MNAWFTLIYIKLVCSHEALCFSIVTFLLMYKKHKYLKMFWTSFGSNMASSQMRKVDPANVALPINASSLHGEIYLFIFYFFILDRAPKLDPHPFKTGPGAEAEPWGMMAPPATPWTTALTEEQKKNPTGFTSGMPKLSFAADFVPVVWKKMGPLHRQVGLI